MQLMILVWKDDGKEYSDTGPCGLHGVTGFKAGHSPQGYIYAADVVDKLKAAHPGRRVYKWTSAEGYKEFDCGGRPW